MGSQQDSDQEGCFGLNLKVPVATIRVPVEVATIRIKPFMGDLDSTVVDLDLDKN